MKNHTLLTAITLLVGTTGFLSTAIIITQVVLGYSGFKSVNAKTVFTLA